jgi:hypothetical protein
MVGISGACITHLVAAYISSSGEEALDVDDGGLDNFSDFHNAVFNLINMPDFLHEKADWQEKDFKDLQGSDVYTCF